MTDVMLFVRGTLKDTLKKMRPGSVGRLITEGGLTGWASCMATADLDWVGRQQTARPCSLADRWVRVFEGR